MVTAMKRVITLFMAVALLLSLLPVTVSATSGPYITYEPETRVHAPGAKLTVTAHDIVSSAVNGHATNWWITILKDTEERFNYGTSIPYSGEPRIPVQMGTSTVEITAPTEDGDYFVYLFSNEPPNEFARASIDLFVRGGTAPERVETDMMISLDKTHYGLGDTITVNLGGITPDMEIAPCMQGMWIDDAPIVGWVSQGFAGGAHDTYGHWEYITTNPERSTLYFTALPDNGEGDFEIRLYNAAAESDVSLVMRVAYTVGPAGSALPPGMTAPVKGRLSDSAGNPMANVIVALFSDPITTVTNSNGAFTIENAPLGTHTLRVYATQADFDSDNPTAEIGNVTVDVNAVTIGGITAGEFLLTVGADGNIAVSSVSAADPTPNNKPDTKPGNGGNIVVWIVIAVVAVGVTAAVVIVITKRKTGAKM